MSQDIVADSLNQIMNAQRVEKTSLTLKRYNKVLINLFEIMKEKGHIDYKVKEGNEVDVEIIKLNECKAVKPRYYVDVISIDKYLRRYLPSRNFGELIISTNKGLMSHKEALGQRTGGSLIAYFY